MTQAEKIVRELRRGWRTWWHLQRLVGQSPNKRLDESGGKYLREGESIERAIRNGLVHLRVTRKG
jgi:hypothetical protein